jgi:hypothetical protein
VFVKLPSSGGFDVGQRSAGTYLQKLLPVQAGADGGQRPAGKYLQKLLVLSSGYL